MIATRKTFKVIVLLIFSTVFITKNLLRPGETEAQWFQQPSVWTTPIPTNPVIRANSNDYRDDFKLNSSNFGVNYTGWATTVWKAQSTDPKITITIRHPNSTIKNNIVSKGWNIVPMPAAAVPPGQADGHVIIYNDQYVWETYQAQKTDNLTWSVYSMRRWDRSGMGVIGQYDNSGSVHNCATSSKLLGTITKAELDAGQINHALMYTYSSERKVDGGAWREYPCRVYYVGSSTRTWAHNAGFVFQLDPRINVDALTVKPAAKVILKAMQRYGMILTDNSGKGYNNLLAESETGKSWSWGDTFSSLNWSNLILDNLRLIQCHSADCPGYVSGSNTVSGSAPASPTGLTIGQ